MDTWVHFSRSSPSNSWWQTMPGWQVLSRPSAAEGGGRRPAFTGLATRPYSATEVDGWQHKLSRVSQNRAAVHAPPPSDDDHRVVRIRRRCAKMDGMARWRQSIHHSDRNISTVLSLAKERDRQKDEYHYRMIMD